jgi:hypothetical protein
MGGTETPDVFAAPEGGHGIVRKTPMLLVDSNRKHLLRLAQVLRPVGAEITVREALGTLPQDGEFALVAVNYDGLTSEEREALIAHFSGPSRSTRLLLLSEGQCRTDFALLFGSHAMTNLLAKSDEVDPQELIVTVEKILRGDIFGIEKYFVWGIQPVRMRLTRSTQKAECLRTAQEYVATIGISGRLASLFYSVVDELFTNAIFNAPVDAEGGHRFAHLPRSSEVVLEDEEEVQMTFCFDGDKLGISVIDRFGSLTEDVILDYLAKCFRKQDDQVDAKSGGAGLGLYHIFDSLSGFIINIRPGKQTEMMGFIDVTNTYREFATKGKSFNIFVCD